LLLAVLVTACAHGLASHSGRILTVTELASANQPPGEYVIEGYVLYVLGPCSCPEGAACSICPNPHLLLADRPESPELCRARQIPCLLLDPPSTAVSVGHRYRLRVLLYDEPFDAVGPATSGAVIEAVPR